jgi:hypothetical protein
VKVRVSLRHGVTYRGASLTKAGRRHHAGRPCSGVPLAQVVRPAHGRHNATCIYAPFGIAGTLVLDAAAECAVENFVTAEAKEVIPNFLGDRVARRTQTSHSQLTAGDGAQERGQAFFILARETKPFLSRKYM